MKKVLFVATVVKQHIMEFHVPYLKMFKEAGWETYVAAKNDYENPNDCNIPYCDHYINVPFERSPVDPRNILAYIKLRELVKKEGFDIVHCHTPVGGVLARLTSAPERKKGTRVIYTAHGFHFYKGAPIQNWLIFYPIERAMAHYTDVLITINKEDYKRAKHFKAKTVEYVPGVGVDTARFYSAGSGTELRESIGIPEGKNVLLSVGELNTNKNHKVVIEALPQLIDYCYVICGRGPLAEEYENLARELGVSDRLKLVGYRTDVADFYKMADAFVFPSFREGLSLSLMEAMASGLPCVASKIRGNTDLLARSKLFIDPKSRDSVASKISLLKDTQIVAEEKRFNEETIEAFSMDKVMQRMQKIYDLK